MSKMSFVLDDGTTIEYEVILIFKSGITGKQYILYTDNKKTINDENKYYLCIFNKETNTKIEEITDENEYKLVSEEARKMLGDKND
jgi:uncharacterized protein YrzB (UPF0473 family)